MGSSCIAGKPKIQRPSLPSNPEAIFESPAKGKNDFKPKNSKLISLSASPCPSSILTVEKLPESLPESSFHPTPVNSVFNIND